MLNMNPQEIILMAILLSLLGYFLWNVVKVEKLNVMKFVPTLKGTVGYSDDCEFVEDCLWDAARTVPLHDGSSGVCTLHGKACPSFELDRSRDKFWGMSPTMVDQYFQEQVDEGKDEAFCPGF